MSMRNYINLYDQYLEEKQDLSQILNPVSDIIPNKQYFEENKIIPTIEKTFPSDKGKIWFSLIVRLSIVYTIVHLNKDYAKYKGYYEKLLSDFNKGGRGHLTTQDISTMPGFKDMITNLQHYTLQPIGSIQNYNYGRKSYQEVIKDFERLEQEYKEKVGVDWLNVQQSDEIVIEFPDGYKWVNLHRSGCQDEADAMGHCGNVGWGDNDDTIISLRQYRQFGDTTKAMPFLTFILDEEGFLGEMKGRNNDKPTEKYHPYIVKLLQSSLINGIKGGGYKPENNFSLGDLPEAQAQNLIKMKPLLGDIQYYAKIFTSFTDDPVLVNGAGHAMALYINQIADEDISKYKPEQQIVEITREYSNLSEFITDENFSDDEYAWNAASETLSGENIFLENTVMLSLKEMDITEITEYVKNHIKSNYDESDYEDIDFNDESDLEDFLDQEGDELIDTIKYAYNDAYNMALESEFIDDIRKALDGIEPEEGDFEFHIYQDGEIGIKYLFDTPLSLCIKVNAFNIKGLSVAGSEELLNVKAPRLSIPDYPHEFNDEMVIKLLSDNFGINVRKEKDSKAIKESFYKSLGLI